MEEALEFQLNKLLKRDEVLKDHVEAMEDILHGVKPVKEVGKVYD